MTKEYLSFSHCRALSPALAQHNALQIKNLTLHGNGMTRNFDGVGGGAERSGGGICVIEVNENDLGTLRWRQRRESGDGLFNKGMWDLGHGAAWDFTIAEKSAVNISSVSSGKDFFEGLIPFVPLIDVGQEEDCASRTVNLEGQCIGKLIAVWNEVRRN